MTDSNSELNDVHAKMMFDVVYEEMSDKNIAAKYKISLKELQLIKNSEEWKSGERKMWDKMIAALLYRRNVSKMSA